MDLTGFWQLLRFLLIGITSGTIASFARSENVLDGYLGMIYKYRVNSWGLLVTAITASACALLEPAYAATYVTAVALWPALDHELRETVNDRMLVSQIKLRLPFILPAALVGIVVQSQLFATALLWIVYYVIGAITSLELANSGVRPIVLVSAVTLQTILIGTILPSSWSWALTCAFMAGQMASPLVKKGVRAKRCDHCRTLCIACKNADRTYLKAAGVSVQ